MNVLTFRPTATRAASLSSLAAGLLWVAAWLHLLMTHGTSQVNEQRLALGLTWLDSGRLVAPSLLLAAAAIWLMAGLAGHRRLRVAATVAVLGLGVAAAGALLGFWTQPIGTYVGASRENGVAAVGGAVAMLGSVIMAPAIAAFAVMAARAQVIPVSATGLVVLGALSAVPWLYESLQGVGFGLALLGLGSMLARGVPPRAVGPEPSSRPRHGGG